MTNPHLTYLMPEDTEFLCGLLFKELSIEVAESKKIGAVINHHRINELQRLYLKMVRHRNKLIKSKIKSNESI